MFRSPDVDVLKLTLLRKINCAGIEQTCSRAYSIVHTKQGKKHTLTCASKRRLESNCRNTFLCAILSQLHFHSTRSCSTTSSFQNLSSSAIYNSYIKPGLIATDKTQPNSLEHTEFNAPETPDPLKAPDVDKKHRDV